MKLQTVRAGDIVQCRVRGAEFHAIVRGRDDTGLALRRVLDRGELPRGLEIPHVKAFQVIAIFHRSRAKTAAQRRAERVDLEREAALA